MSLLKNYIFWTYDRGSLHYDVMVTLILAFLFISPHYINFGDKPVTNVPLQRSQVLIKEQASTGTEARFVYEIRVDDLHGATNDSELRQAILDVIEPIAGGVTLVKYMPVLDTKGHIVAYDATVLR